MGAFIGLQQIGAHGSLAQTAVWPAHWAHSSLVAPLNLGNSEGAGLAHNTTL
jgi:hypothetical protein